MVDPRRSFGAEGETRAARWYRDHGYEVLERNWRCRAGEIDLVVRRGRELVFVEVKTRRSALFGTPAEAVTPAKQARLRGLAVQYLRDSATRGTELRFDVVAILAGEMDVIEAAF